MKFHLSIDGKLAIMENGELLLFCNDTRKNIFLTYFSWHHFQIKLIQINLFRFFIGYIHKTILVESSIIHENFRQS